MTSYISHSIEDKCSTINYNNRFLDALASFFCTHGNATAVIKVENNIYLSYSNNHLNVPDQKYFFDFIRNCILEGTVDQLIAIYLISNADFKGISLKLSKFFKSAAQLANDQISNVDSNEKQSVTELKKRLEEVANKFSQLEFDRQKSFKTLGSELKKKNDTEIKLLDTFSSVVQQYKELFLYKSYLQLNEFSSVFKLYESYLQLDESLKRYKNLLSYEAYLRSFEEFLRPMQDAYKLHYYFNESGKIEHIQAIPNLLGLHADTNIASTFTVPEKDFSEKHYIGVSKLCCGYCHAYLDHRGFKHRGTHGICDDQWIFPWPCIDKKDLPSPFEASFRKSVKLIREFDSKQFLPQHRKLSYDFFERDIQLNEGSTLYKLKCDLLDSINYDFSDEYGYYCFNGTEYIQI